MKPFHACVGKSPFADFIQIAAICCDMPILNDLHQVVTGVWKDLALHQLAIQTDIDELSQCSIKNRYHLRVA